MVEIELDGQKVSVQEGSMRFSTMSANSLSILLVSLASIATASGQTAKTKLNPNEPLEKYNMPPVRREL